METTMTDTPKLTDLADQAKNNLGELAHDTKEQVKATVSKAKEQAQEAVAQTKQKAGELIGQAKDQIQEQIVTKKDTATGTLHDFASSLRGVSQQWGSDTQTPVNQYAKAAADQIDRLSDYLENRDLNQITQDAERFARQQPALFLGGAFFLGILAARFLRSSERHAPTNGMDYDRSHALVPVDSESIGSGGYTAHDYVPGGIAGQGNQPAGSHLATGANGIDRTYPTSTPIAPEL
jgi:hypothetical protein